MTGANARILIAGVGNVLHADDGFGVELARRLTRRALPAGVTVLETGIGGMSLVQELMRGYDALLLLDAHDSGQPAGTLRLLEPVLPDLSALDAHALRDYFADTHYATPIRALALLERLGHLPHRVAVLGCQPEEHQALRIGLSRPVDAALGRAEQIVGDWIHRMLADEPPQHRA
jgi:hydrogenase maturation protease